MILDYIRLNLIYLSEREFPYSAKNLIVKISLIYIYM